MVSKMTTRSSRIQLHTNRQPLSRFWRHWGTPAIQLALTLAVVGGVVRQLWLDQERLGTYELTLIRAGSRGARDICFAIGPIWRFR
jgi:hypothetical protein